MLSTGRSGSNQVERAALMEADSGQPMADQTAIDVYERGNYSEDHRKHRDSDADAPRDRQSTKTTPP